MIPPSRSKPEVLNDDVEQLNEVLKIQLEHQRAQWTKARERYRAVRSLSFVFLFVVIAGALFGLFYILSRLQH